MKNIIFLKGNNERCLVAFNSNIFTIETDNPIDTIRIGNKIIKGNDLTNENPDYVNEVNEFINNITNKNHYELISNRNLDISSSYKIITNPTEIENNKKTQKILILDGLSPSSLLSIYNIQLINTAVIITMQGKVIISYINEFFSNKYCIQCLIKRFMYSNYKVYKYSELWSQSPNSISNDNLSKYISIAKGLISNKRSEAIVIDRLSGDTIKSKVLPIEGCKVCFHNSIHDGSNILEKGNSYIKQENGFRIMSDMETNMLLTNFVNPLGPVINIEDNQMVDRICLPVYQSEIGINPLKKGFRFHGGKGRTQLQAKFSAIGEALERYNAQMFGNEIIISKSFNEMTLNGMNVLCPKELLLDPNYPTKYSNDLCIDWTPSINMVTHEKVWVPSNAIYFVYFPKDGSNEFMPQDTTGLASGTSDEEAILQGLMEIIERDAYTIYYRYNIKPQIIDLSSIKDILIQSLIYKLRTNKIKIHLVLLKTDLPFYVVHCTTESEDGNFPKFTHGAGASLKIEVAISRAVTECVQLRTSQIKIFKNKDLFINDNEYKPYIEWGNGNEEYVGSLMGNKNDKYISLDKLPDLSSGNLHKDISFIVNELYKKGYVTYSSSLTRKDNPVSTVRTIVTGLQPSDDTLRRTSKRMNSIGGTLSKANTGIINGRILFS